jgi:hypothetical protein
MNHSNQPPSGREAMPERPAPVVVRLKSIAAPLNQAV